MLRRLRQRCASEAGSVMIAMLVAIIVGGLATTITARTVQGQSSVRFDREFTAVVHGAEAGVQEALAQLKDAEEASQTGFVPVQADPPGVIDGIEYTWTAEYVDVRVWRVVSTGTRNGISRTVEVTIEDRPRFPVAMFADTLVSMAGANAVDSYNATTWCTRNGLVGSNTAVTFTGSAQVGPCATNATPVWSGRRQHAGRTVDRVVLYNWAALPGASAPPHNPRCTQATSGQPNCSQMSAAFPSPEIVQHRLDLDSDAAVQFMNEAVNQCSTIHPTWYTSSPPDGTVTPNTFSPAPSDPGHWCVENLVINNDVTVVGATPENPVKIYVTGQVGFSGPHRRVNCQGPHPGGCEPGVNFPQARNLQIYLLGTLAVNFTAQLEFAGVLHAPRAVCTGPNAQADIFGVLVCRSVPSVGGFQFHYDDRLSEIGTGEYDITTWAESP